MDISDLLASMQTDPGSRALARRTKQGAPTADGSPADDSSTATSDMQQDTGAGTDASQGEDMSQAADPSQGAIPDATPAPAISDNADVSQQFARGGVVKKKKKAKKKYADGGAIPDDRVQKFANGGDVEIEGMRERERAAVRAEEQNRREAQHVHSGADAAIMELPDDYDGRPLPENEQYAGKPMSGPTRDPARMPGGIDYDGDNNVENNRRAKLGYPPKERENDPTTAPYKPGKYDPNGPARDYGYEIGKGPKSGDGYDPTGPAPNNGSREFGHGQPKGMRVFASPGSGFYQDEGVTVNGQHNPQPDWREPAHQAINAGIAYGHKKHVPNAPLDDGTGEQRVGAMLSGDGATPHPQLKALEEGVDPDNTMDPSSRTLKAAQVANDFYSKQGPEGGAAAVWGLLQGKRKEFNAHAAAASVNNDNGKPENAAQLAEGALNAVPDGLHATVTPTRREAAKKAIGGALATAAGMASKVGSVIGNPAKATMDASNEYLDAPVDQPEGKAAPVGYTVNLADPDSGKAIYSGNLNKEQLNDLMSHGWDKMLHGGTQAALQQSASKTEGHGHIAGADRPVYQPGQDQLPISPDARMRPPGGRDSLRPATNDGQQDVAEINGIPRGTNIKNMSVGQVSRLRKTTAAGASEGATQRATALNESRERMVDAQQKGLNNRLGSAPGQQAANMRKADDLATKDTKTRGDTTPFKDEAERDAYHQQRLKVHQQAMRVQAAGGGGAAPAAPKAAGGFKPGPGWFQNKKTGQYRDPQGNLYDEDGNPVDQSGEGDE